MNFEYFWIYEALIEERQLDIGFDLYCIGHIIWLAATVLAAIVGSNIYIKQKERNKEIIKKIFAITLLLSEIIKDVVVLIIGAPMIDYLPLHLCSFAIFGLMFDAFGIKRKITTQMIAFGFFPGAVAALLFCNWTCYPFMNFMCIHSFTFHAWIVIYFVMLYRAGEIRPEYKGIWNTTKVLIVVAVPVVIFNRIFDTNYLFLNEASEGSPLVAVWNIFGTRFGLPGYIAGAILLVIIVFHILFVVYNALEKVSNKKRG